MKYTTFRTIVIAVPVLLIGGILLLGEDMPSKLPVAGPSSGSSTSFDTSDRVPDPAVSVNSAVSAGLPVAANGNFRPMDDEIFAAANANIIGDKVKDAIPGRLWKVNLYKDAGSASVNRLKVDLDRDE